MSCLEIVCACEKVSNYRTQKMSIGNTLKAPPTYVFICVNHIYGIERGTRGAQHFFKCLGVT